MAMPLLDITIKDWIIIVTSIILLFSLLETRKLKKIVTREVQARLLPQLVLELVLDTSLTQDMGLYLKNESLFLAKDIQIEDLALTLDDLGFKVNYILKFDTLDSLRPHEKTKLNLKVFDKNQEFMRDVTEKIIPHLISPSFRVKINCSNIENLRFSVALFKKREKFFIAKIEPYQ